MGAGDQGAALGEAGVALAGQLDRLGGGSDGFGVGAGAAEQVGEGGEEFGLTASEIAPVLKGL